MEGNESVKNIVRAFAKEQAELNKRFMEKPTVKPKPEEEIKPTEKKPEDKSTSIAHVEDWSNWKPPTISSANDPFESHIGLRQTKQRMERQSQNQETKKKAEIPGTYIEEEKEEERVIIPTKFQNSNIPKPDQPEEEIENIANKNEDEGITKEERKFRKPQKKQVETKLKIDKIIKKIMQQKIKLTVEEILRMSPNFVHKLQELSEKDKEKIKSLNSMDIQERLLKFGFKEIPKPKIHYACPLGFMEIFIGKEEYPIKALVDTGAELNIIPEEIAIKASLTTRNLNMNLRGIGGHTTSLVALSEFTPIILASGEETQIHFFIAKGSVHTVLGRPFLADNNIRLEFSHKQGEILSYQEPDGRRLCMPICKTQTRGWQTGPPRGMDLCNMAKLVRNNPGKKDQNVRRDNTIINLTQKTQELSISLKSDKCGPDLQNKKWQNNRKRKLEDSNTEEELPNMIYKPIDKDEQTFQILVDGNEKRNESPFKNKPKRKKVRFSEHHELSDEEIINEIKK
ncbi:hypothetical protein O181_088871 [Austropuccinia psidii MF-1]|uniref:Peptidase A2 domain-containing protein n=1 Tax=Austropuccinia psidii MF-1 TaxID=1389203 RepID=A0A9Q3P7B5_9BASI|nr:hypothetical protein [Austropuccinia psidii MF-1]